MLGLFKNERSGPLQARFVKILAANIAGEGESGTGFR